MDSQRILGTGLLLTMTVLAACNGGIGGTGGKDGGTKADISVGTVSALGSVEVNGVTFDTSTATITIDESASLEADLKEGMVVEVRGSIDTETTGSATTVVAEDVIKGPITDMLVGNDAQIEVLGQRVDIDSASILTNSNDDVLTIINFANNELVEISGFVKASGVVAATRIQKETVLSNYKLKGFITNKMPTTFSIGNQTIDFSGVDTGNLPGGVPANDMLVEVKAAITLGGSGELIATRIELEEIKNSEGSEIELEGYVTDATGAPDTFYIGSQQVQTTGTTLFKGGLPADIRFGIEVEAEGQISGGILIASEVEFEPSAEVEADTAAVNVMAGTVTLAATAGGLVVLTNADTEISTLTGTGNSLADLNAGGGNHLQVRGSFDPGSGTIIAKKIEEKTTPDTDVVLRGPVTAKSATTIDIMGVIITPDVSAEYRDESGQSIVDLNTFLGQVTVGTTIVEAESKVNAPLVWDKLSLEY
jgi:hypothetical protein